MRRGSNVRAKITRHSPEGPLKHPPTEAIHTKKRAPEPPQTNRKPHPQNSEQNPQKPDLLHTKASTHAHPQTLIPSQPHKEKG